MSDATKIQNPSITPKDFTIQDNKIIAISGIPVSGAGGTMSDYVYYPSFDKTNGNITFTLGTTQEHPGPYGPYHISGDPGESGKDGVSPTVTVTNISADPTDPNHKKGGTEITITDATTTNKFSAWNGNDGTMADAPGIEGKNGISAILDGSTYKVGLSGTFYNAVTSVSSKLAESDFTVYTATTAPNTFQPKGNYVSANEIADMATQTWVGQQNYLTSVPDTYALKSDIPTMVTDLTDSANYQTVAGMSDYLTKSSAHNEFVNTSSWANNKFQVKGNYATTSDISDMATQTWVGNQHYLTTIPDEYITESELASYNYATTSTTNSLSSQIDEISSTLNDKYTLSAGDGINFVEDAINKITKIECTVVVPTTVAQLTDSNNYYKKTETSGANELSTEFAKYLTTAQYNTDSATFALKTDLNGLANSASVTTNDDYVMTSAGWKVLTLPAAGMTKVYHDTTLIGDGNADNSKLGVAWSVLSANTINSAKSASNAQNAYIASAYYDSQGSLSSISATFDALEADMTNLNNKYSLPFNVGNNNETSISNDSTWSAWSGTGYGVIGNNSKIGRESFVFGQDSIAANNSTVLNNGNSANHDSLAGSWHTMADNHSIAWGLWTYSNNYSFIVGHGNSDNKSIADNFSITVGDACKAYNYSQTFGRGLEFTGGTGGTGKGALVCGGWNKTQSNALFVVGNGTGNGNNRSDAMVVTEDGNVSAKQYKAEGYTQNNTYVEARVPKSLPNSGDNAMVVQKMFVCTSDPDIVAHANLANGEGCIFFRVG